MSYDTTSSNTGKNSGACTLLEKKIGRPLLGLACRHHMHELLVAKCFNITVEHETSGPDIKMFKTFQESWCRIDVTKYESALLDNDLVEKLGHEKTDILTFIENQLSQFHPRDDYKELLQLCSIFLGVKKTIWIFHPPGAIHRARWMAKIIYTFKIYLFRSQLQLTEIELYGIKDFLLFICKVYLKHWFLAPSATAAPNNDLKLLKSIDNYKNENENISKEIQKVFYRHLWYMTEELVGLSFFDDMVDVTEKRKMVKALSKKSSSRNVKRLQGSPELVDKNLSDFVSQNTKLFFKMLKLDQSFLKQDPSLWKSNKKYIKNVNRVSQLKVVNDTAERGVALAESYNKTFTKDEVQQQQIFQVVEDHRKIFMNTNISTISDGLKKKSRNN